MSPKNDPDGEEVAEIGEPLALASTKRSRWATRKLTVKSSGLKRLSLKARKGRRGTSEEKKRASAGSETLRQDGTVQGDDESADSGGVGQRQLYFNLPLPDSAKDEEGYPIQHYARNKIRTAKYTPLSFIPKNLWFQFHNVANIFFLFIVILVVSNLLTVSCLAGHTPRNQDRMDTY
jgi:phospholipid-translocating ATPase